jgi:ABC-type multidrug transport system fused ATPase/permease subunit
MLTGADWCGMRVMRAMQVGFFVIYVTPAFLLFVLPLGYVYFKVQDFYRNSSRELKRLEAVSKSPIFSHFSETLNGLSTIRAFNTQAKASRTRPNSVFTCFTYWYKSTRADETRGAVAVLRV